jgi:hypothetical protein
MAKRHDADVLEIVVGQPAQQLDVNVVYYSHTWFARYVSLRREALAKNPCANFIQKSTRPDVACSAMSFRLALIAKGFLK